MNPPTSFAPPVWPVREDPGESPMLMARGLMALDAGRYDEAVRYFVDAIKRRSGDGIAYCHLGQALLGTGAWEIAARAFNHVLDGVPGHVPALIGLGQALGACGRAGEALAALERALEHAPDSAIAHFCRGNALRDLGQADAALEAFERSIALDAGHMPAHLLRGMLLGERQRHTEALACFERALALHPQAADAHFGIGRVHESLGDHASAGRAYTEALRIAPTHVPSLTGLSNALLAAKRYDLALAQIMQVEVLVPGRPYVQSMGVSWPGNCAAGRRWACRCWPVKPRWWPKAPPPMTWPQPSWQPCAFARSAASRRWSRLPLWCCTTIRRSTSMWQACLCKSCTRSWRMRRPWRVG